MNQAWKPINDILWECPYKFSSGITRSLLVKLSEKKFLVYSPGDRNSAELAKQVIPTDSQIFLLAPNSYHNLGLKHWKDVFPQSRITAGAGAIKRLEKQTGIKPENLDVLKGVLPNHISLMELLHNRIGEVFLDIQTPGERIWVICDAVFNFPNLAKGVMGFLMKLNRMGPGLEISRMYQYMGTSNAKNYGQWLMNQLNERKPSKLIPLHGDIESSKDLPEKLQSLIRSRLM